MIRHQGISNSSGAAAGHCFVLWFFSSALPAECSLKEDTDKKSLEKEKKKGVMLLRNRSFIFMRTISVRCRLFPAEFDLSKDKIVDGTELVWYV